MNNKHEKCQDCICLVEINDTSFCDEIGKSIYEIDVCPEESEHNKKQKNNVHIIEFKNKVLETIHYVAINDEEYKKIKSEYYQKPDKKYVLKEIEKLNNGGLVNTNITNYYFKDIMAKTKLYHSKWSIEDVFNCKDLVSFFYGKTLYNKKIFPDNHSITKKIETVLRLGGKGVASKPTNFPLKTANEILRLYNINNNYYDFSCGWGVRLTSALINNINYFGTDPNNLLVDRLNELANDFKQYCNKSTIADIRCEGSEVFIPEWENKMGICFSSPPYFGLENYEIGKQSYKEGMKYDEWINNYLKPTIKNLYKYLINNGNLIINVNNYDKYDLVNTVKNACIENNFYLVNVHNLKNIKRTNSKEGFNNNDEEIMIFKKNI